MNTCWMRWCRLCAKEDGEVQEEQNALNAMMVTAIGKYFWVNIMPEDKLPHSVCSECHDMVTGLMEFSQHVNKVQSMYYELMRSDIKYAEKSKEIRINYGIEEQEIRYVLKKEKKNSNNIAVAGTDTGEFHWLENDCCNRNSEEHTLELHVELQNPFTEPEELAKVDKPLKFEISCEKDILNVKEIECTKNNSYMVKIPKHSNVEERGAEEEGEEQDEDEEFNDIVHHNDDDGNNDDNNNDENDNNDDDDAYDDNEDVQSLRRSTRHTILRKQNLDKLDLSNDSNNSDCSIGRRTKKARNTTDDEEEEAPCESRFKCKICKRKYKNPTSYRRHMLENHKTEPDIPDFKCVDCGKIYPTVKQLSIHERTHLPLELKMDIPCPYCEKKMSKVTVLRQHIKGQHSNNKPFICDECGKALKTMAALNEHKLVHTNECPFECEICHKRFKNKARLKSHSDVHAESTYSCHVCGMRLNTRRTLKMHMVVHSEDKQYKCNLCPQAFKRGKALKNHLILHTGMRPYKCTFCEKTFSNGSNCRAHKKKIHPIELANEEAEGIKSTSKTIVPRLEELRTSTNVAAPRRTIRGSPAQLLKLMTKRNKTKTQTQNGSNENFDEDDNDMTTLNYNCKSIDGSEDELLINAEDVDADNDDDNVGIDEHNGETTMVYQIVEDM